jgi:hypothetical protein
VCYCGALEFLLRHELPVAGLPDRQGVRQVFRRNAQGFFGMEKKLRGDRERAIAHGKNAFAATPRNAKLPPLWLAQPGGDGCLGTILFRIQVGGVG